jgi:mRNA interferase RelE/StbE
MPTAEERRYRVLVHKTASKILARLPKDLLRRITVALDGLALDPRPSGCKKLAGKYDHYRVRVGDWRITYTIEDDMLVVTVIEIAPRGGAYRNP